VKTSEACATAPARATSAASAQDCTIATFSKEGKGVTEHSPKDAKAVAEIQALWAHLNTLNPVTKPKKAKA
jgi:hypothetical protein